MPKEEGTTCKAAQQQRGAAQAAAILIRVARWLYSRDDVTERCASTLNDCAANFVQQISVQQKLGAQRNWACTDSQMSQLGRDVRVLAC